MDRRDRILADVEPGMRVIELGGGYAPIAPKSAGWNTCTVDHAPREELVAKYTGVPGVDVSRIEEVDVVWTSGPLHDAVPRVLHGTFDACVGSHVLEHIPDPLGLLRSMEVLLAPRGVISLAIPDKRFCFDFFKPLSSVGELLEAHRAGATRHAARTAFDHKAYSISSGGEIAWGAGPMGERVFLDSLEDAQAVLDETWKSTDADPYVDFHAWQFTPSSFELAILELGHLGEIEFAIRHAVPTEGCEFYVTLERRAASARTEEELQQRRLELLERTLEEIAEQASCLRPVAPSRDGAVPTSLVRRLRVRVRLRTRVRAAFARVRGL
jgi:SAM-dependent methyltransferase